MRIFSGKMRLSATDVSNHLACRHLTSLEVSAARGERARPNWEAPDLAVIRELGLRHEAGYLAFLSESGLSLVNLAGIEESRMVRETLRAMELGVEVIAQGALSCGQWFGRPDILRKVDKPSRFGDWSYEAYDCKLARETKATTILQLAFYSELLGEIQGTRPAHFYVVPKNKHRRPERYRVEEYAAYYRHVKTRLEAACGNSELTTTYPEPCTHCDVCQWFRECDRRRRGDDHLSLVAGITLLQRKQLRDWSIETMAKLAAMPIPLQQKPLHGSREGMERVREQARLQVEGRTLQKSVHELLPVAEGTGFYKLPEPSPGDVFVDLEGDPFAGDDGGGHQYLFGFVAMDEDQKLTYEKRWALTPTEEKLGFEWFVDEVTSRLRKFPGLHVYHFGANEPSRFRHLMGRYATRQEEIDSMLRAALFVDVHVIFKQALRASVEEYSLKKLEEFYGFERTTSLAESRVAMRFVEHRLVLGWDDTELPEGVRTTLEGYNGDDCLSTAAMRDWLEGQRAKKEADGIEIARPIPNDGAAPEDLKEWQQRVAGLVEDLTRDIPTETVGRSKDQEARWLMAQLLDWHWREAKPSVWEFYRLADKDDEALLDEREALSGLTFDKRLQDGPKPVERYRFIKQETQVRAGKEVWHREERVGTVVAINLVDRTLDIQKVTEWAGKHPSSVFVREPYRRPNAQKESLYRLGCWIRDNGVDSPGLHRAARDLLLRNPPKLLGAETGKHLEISAGEGFENGVCRIVSALSNSVLAIQGPPGSGKTTLGAKIVDKLVRARKKVAVSALSHEVIHYLLTKVITAPGGDKIRCLHKCPAGSYGDDGIATANDNKKPLKLLKSADIDVVGATSWMWPLPEFADVVDVLVVDEAGQMSLADVLAMAQSAKSIVLIGDPQQLARPQKGSHPEGSERSALEHLLTDPILGKLKTMPSTLGLFIPETKRLHPKTCIFTSEVFYEGQLTPLSFTANRVLDGHPVFDKAGLWFVPVNHEGNCNSSPEEVDVVEKIVKTLLLPDVKWFYGIGNSRRLRRDEDILIVAPYNAQVSDLSERLPGMKVGTVDKFQGQEAAVVIYSLTTSTPEDAPRGMEFLYSLNRFNVATSRAKTAVIVVGSPRLFEPECKSPRQMQLANAFCAYLEKATVRPSVT